jgi:preprotein translocase subunit YajC
MNLMNWNALLADAPAPAMQPNPTGSMILQFAPIVVLVIIFYVIMIRPQSKKAKEHAALLSTMKPGDRVVTSAGVVGVLVSVKDRTVAIRSADTKLEVLKSSVSEITERAGAANPSES